MPKAGIVGISYYLPEKVLDNEMLNEAHPEWSVAKISAKTGISKRHISECGQCASDLAFEAVRKLFAEYNIEPGCIDFLLLCTQSPDFFLPTTACILQNRLGLSTKCGAFDFNLGCSGFVYGLGIAKGLIETSQSKNVLLITAETYSKYIHPLDKSNRTIFGDAAAATLISSTLSNKAGIIGDFEYRTDGSGSEFLVVKNGGHRNRNSIGVDVFTDEDFVRNDDNLYMNGKEIFSFTVLSVPDLIRDTIKRNSLKENNIDLYVLHQANDYLLQTIRKRCGISPEKFFTHISNCGNTVSSTIPIALYHALQMNKIIKGNKVLISGFGVGLSSSATILSF